MTKHTNIRPDQRRRIGWIALTISLICLVTQEFLLWFFLWLMAFDFTTRRPALGLAALFATGMGGFIFAWTFAVVAGWLADEVAAKNAEQSRNP